MNALEVRALRKVYPGGKVALDSVDLSVQEGDFFALIGPNGAGKTTLIGIISSLLNKTSGEIEVFGDSLEKNKRSIQRAIGLVPQEFNFNTFETVLEILLNQAGYYGIPLSRARTLAKKYLGALELLDNSHTVSRNLSGGMKRRLMIARALVHEPRLLILDEPTAGVDISIRRQMWDFLKQLNRDGTTIILTSHYLEEIENLCRHAAVINHGKFVAKGTVDQLAKHISKQTYVLDVEFPAGYDIAHLSKICPVLSVSPQHIEFEIDDKGDLKAIFLTLFEQNIHVQSMRSKYNRLEEFFINLINQ